MNILICATRMGIGGAETHILTLSAALIDMGHRVTVVSSGGSYVERLCACGAGHITLPLDRKTPSAMLSCRRAIRAIATGDTGNIRYDIVSAHGRIPAFVCGLLRRDPAFPALVVTAHGFYRDSALLGRLSAWGKHVIAVSDDVKSYLIEQFRLSPEKITVVRNGVDLEVPPHQPGKNLRISTASRLDGDTARTALLLCRVMPTLRAEFPQLAPTLVIAGGGSRLAEVREAAREANMSCPGLVTVVGDVTNMPALYARTDVFVGASRAAMEAMAASLPVLLCSDTGCAGVLDETNIRRAEVTNLTCRDEPETSAERILAGLRRLCTISARERANLGQFGRRYISVYGSAETMARQYLDVFEQTISETKSGIMLCGSFGRENVGDEAVLENILDVTTGIAPDVIPTIPAPLGSRLPEGVKHLPRLLFPLIRRELNRTRLFVLCGGTLLQNNTSTRSLWYYYRLTELAAKKGARIMIWGGGAGPIFGEKARMMAACTAEYADTVCLRDPDSRTLLEKIGVETSFMNITADHALMTLPSPLSPELELNPNDYFAVSVRPLAGLRGCGEEREKKIIEAIGNAVVEIFEKYHLVPVWIPYAPEDVKLIRELSRSCGAGVVMPLMSPGEVVSVLSSCQFALGLRLHQSVFASCAGIPSLAVAYDPKVASFSAYAKHPPALNPDAENFSGKLISFNVGRLLPMLPRAREMIRGRTRELRALCTETSRAAAALYTFRSAPPEE